MRNLPNRFASVLAFIALASLTGAASAAPVFYTDRQSFLTDLASVGEINTLDFDSQSAGTLISSGQSVDGITFSYPSLAPFVTLNVSDIYDTTSSPNFLGTTDSDIFMDGDAFSLGFQDSNAIGLSIITADAMADGDIVLSAGNGNTSVSLISANIQQTLLDGSNVYFLGIIDSAAAFDTADLTADGGRGGPFFFFNVDDIVTSTTSVVPAPAAVWLFGSGLLCLIGIARRKKS